MYTIKEHSPSALLASASGASNRPPSMTAKRTGGRAWYGFLCRSCRNIGLSAALVLAAMNVQAQNVEDGYVPDLNSWAAAIALQPDGKTLVGGVFTQVNGQPCAHLCRLLPDGTIDPTFVKPDPNGIVYSILVQTDGKILVGGAFDQAGSLARHGVVRLNADGSVDTGFGDAQIVGPVNTELVTTFALQADGKILITGTFDSVGGEPRHAVARLNSNGTVDTNFFDTGADGAAYTVVLQPNGKLLIGGNFRYIRGQLQPSVARLNSDGSSDPQFTALPNMHGAVQALALRADGKIMIGGHFNFFSDPYNYLMRLNADGTIDTSFVDLNVSREVYSLTWQADGKLLVGGAFTEIGGQPRSKAARLNVDGSLDSSFKPNQIIAGYPYQGVNALIPQTDGKVLVAGFFSTPGLSQNSLARLNSDGSVDKTLEPFGADEYGNVPITAVQPDGKVLVAGYSSPDGTSPTHYITRLNLDGSPDPGFVDPAPDGAVSSVVLQADGKLLVSGGFHTIAGASRTGLARLNNDGSLDASLDFGGLSRPQKVAIQPDGKILIISSSLFFIEGKPVESLARLNTDGSLDTSFAPAPIDTFGMEFNFDMDLLLQPDGKILIAGVFDKVGGVTRSGLARLESDGSLDTSFQPPAHDELPYSRLALLPDGKLLTETVDGLRRLNLDGSLDAGFTGPSSSYTVDSYAVQTDGKIVVALNNGYQDWVQRLNANGTTDNNFGYLQTDRKVWSLTILPGGTLLLGGTFHTVESFGHAKYNSHLARVSLPVAAQQRIDVSGDKVTWYRSGNGPELRTAPTLYYSNGGAFLPLGPMTRVPGGWQRTGVPLPLDSFYYLRAEGTVGSTQSSYQGDGLIQSTRQAFNAEILFTNGFE